ncbi:MAG: GNAT family protein [Sinimarinibacterium sp.]
MRKPLQLEPVTLDGRHVRLEPVEERHFAALCEAGADPAIWAWYPLLLDQPERMREHFDEAIAWQRQGKALAFVQVDRASGRVAGATRLVIMSAPHYRAEVGWTWLNPAFQRTAINTEAKYLLLTHAFETLNLLRVEFKTDALNLASRRALVRIGAVEEGTHRSHMITETGRIRDSAYFSVIERDWPAVKLRLEARLGRADPA